jgi:hypothetical protein
MDLKLKFSKMVPRLEKMDTNSSLVLMTGKMMHASLIKEQLCRGTAAEAMTSSGIVHL